MSITKQCLLLGVPRSSYYHRPVAVRNQGDKLLMQTLDRIYMEEPVFGSRRMVDELEELGHKVGRDRVRRLMREMGIEPIYPKPRLSVPGKGHKVYPYLLRGLNIERSNQVWCTDITYIPLGNTHVYLNAVMDWSSRYVISWRLSNSLDTAFCVECLEEALEREDVPEIFNTDQGSQFTGEAFTLHGGASSCLPTAPGYTLTTAASLKYGSAHSHHPGILPPTLASHRQLV